MVPVDVPEAGANDLEGNRVEFALVGAVKRKLGVHVELGRRQVAGSEALGPPLPASALVTLSRHQLSSTMKFPQLSAESCCPGRTTTVVSGHSTIAGPAICVPVGSVS